MKFINDFKSWSGPHKIIFILTAFVIISYGLIMTGYVQLPGSNKHVMGEHTSAWTTYSNDYYEISYPKEWLGLDTSEHLEGAFNEYNIAPKEPKGNVSEFLFMIIVTKGDINSALSNATDKSKVENVVLNGYNSTKFNQDSAIVYLIEQNGKFFRINYAYNKDHGITKEEADEVLATFKLK